MPFKKPVKEAVDLGRRKFFGMAEEAPRNIPQTYSEAINSTPEQQRSALESKVINEVLNNDISRRNVLKGAAQMAVQAAMPSPLKMLDKVVSEPVKTQRVIDTLLPWQKNFAEALHLFDVDIPNYYNKDRAFDEIESAIEYAEPYAIEDAFDVLKEEGIFIPHSSEMISDMMDLYSPSSKGDFSEFANSIRSKVEGTSELSDEEIYKFLTELKGDKSKVFKEFEESGIQSASDYFDEEVENYLGMDDLYD